MRNPLPGRSLVSKPVIGTKTQLAGLEFPRRNSPPPWAFFAQTIQEQAKPLVEGGNMNGKNGFTGPTGPGEAQMKGESGGGRRARQPVDKRPAGCAEAGLEM